MLGSGAIVWDWHRSSDWTIDTWVGCLPVLLSSRIFAFQQRTQC